MRDCLENGSFEDTGFSYTLSLISGKYKMVILYSLMEAGIMRYNALKRYIGTISHKTLSQSLKELEADALIHREEYPYSLTARGRSLMHILDELCVWGEQNRR